MVSGGNNMATTLSGIATIANTFTSKRWLTMPNGALKLLGQMDQLRLHASLTPTPMIFTSKKVPNTSNKPGNFQVLH